VIDLGQARPTGRRFYFFLAITARAGTKPIDNGLLRAYDNFRI